MVGFAAMGTKRASVGRSPHVGFPRRVSLWSDVLPFFSSLGVLRRWRVTSWCYRSLAGSLRWSSGHGCVGQRRFLGGWHVDWRFRLAYNFGDRQRRRALSSGEQLSELLSDDVPDNVADVPGTSADVVIKPRGGNDAGMSLVVPFFVYRLSSSYEALRSVRPPRENFDEEDGCLKDADRRPLCYNYGEADHVYRQWPYRQLGLRGYTTAEAAGVSDWLAIIVPLVCLVFGGKGPNSGGRPRFRRLDRIPVWSSFGSWGLGVGLALRALGGVNDTVMAELPTFESVRSTMYREKKKRQPSLPRNMAEINLGRLYMETLDKRDFLLFDISISAGRIFLFCTQELLFHFAEVVEVFIDGTFFSCPSLFHQLLTISAVKEGVSFNMAYFLLPGKSREVYVAAFTNFKAVFDALRAPLLLNVVRTDFELALIQAFLFVFPGIRHRGCHFHFSQAIWRKVQDLGLSKAYQEDTSVTLFVRQTNSLTFVPPTFVRVAWRSLKATAPQAPGVPQLILYFEDNWLLGNYKIHQWNHHQNNGARTNNFMEAWHRKINNVIGKAHPNVYTFLEHIKQDEATSRVTLLQVSNGGQARKRQKWR
ncbi:hypothetical protein HPB47_014952 [Ixodes persulcatus]|uniref:Uncharacterized protein n=1 Tax=Ixodes persulcatus TaxID=34615 RepID=A0AC60QYA1_IXOPE|nr:hypothetical protein HPB47_014952 [Ixodes persulcatus]